jgi:hypothetical protein
MAIQQYYPFDKELLFRDVAQSAVTADGYVGTQKNLGGQTLITMAMIINIEAIKVSAGDEAYTFRVVGSQTADRSDARVLAEITAGDAAAKAIETADDAAGEQLVILFQTTRGDANQQYLDLHLDVTGTSPSITFSAFATKTMF